MDRDALAIVTVIFLATIAVGVIAAGFIGDAFIDEIKADDAEAVVAVDPIRRFSVYRTNASGLITSGIACIPFQVNRQFEIHDPNGVVDVRSYGMYLLAQPFGIDPNRPRVKVWGGTIAITVTIDNGPAPIGPLRDFVNEVFLDE